MLRWFKRRLAKTDPPVGADGAPISPPESTQVEIPHDKIAARAAEIWDRKGRPHDQDVQNWMEAEAELRSEFATTASPEPLPRKSR
ncbi:hypothetical protein VT84_30915 [Gemmata sp. SH-PL17]|uniref:DUF2934 domain-containing protein n=1 Tax=Gemmata sp. SH-PL17 TaxID=1630693 RepID=UPI00078E0B3E|nr:DUF2934 domain-containing protein [Gemmata sp. SH-PL17]AMV28846.1 hypothetical protein VT84_30915 [Gemmata sp. SH-PL17]